MVAVTHDSAKKGVLVLVFSKTSGIVLSRREGR